MHEVNEVLFFFTSCLCTLLLVVIAYYDFNLFSAFFLYFQLFFCCRSFFSILLITMRWFASSRLLLFAKSCLSPPPVEVKAPLKLYLLFSFLFYYFHLILSVFVFPNSKKVSDKWQDNAEQLSQVNESSLMFWITCLCFCFYDDCPFPISHLLLYFSRHWPLPLPLSTIDDYWLLAIDYWA